MMRLRLCIQRNSLPAVSIVWPVSDSDLTLTVAQLLKLVDERVPLEGNTWGLEDYVVAIGKYEVLHYSEIGSVCKDEDELVIRALQWRERKHRLLAGRDQVTSDGRHLVDGVPFGRPLIRRATRPEIRIPPIEEQQSDFETEASLQDNLLVEWPDQEAARDNEDSEDDGEYEVSEEDESERNDGDNLELGVGRTASGLKPVNGHTATQDVVTHEQDVSGSSSEESTSDSSSDSDSGSGSDSDSDSGSDSDSNAGSDSGSGSGSGSDTTSEADTGFSSSSDSKSASHGLPDVPLSKGKRRLELSPNGKQTKRQKVGMAVKQNTTLTTAPFNGMTSTQDRNHRRRDSKKLKYLKMQGLLSPEANMDDLRKWQSKHESQTSARNVLSTATSKDLEAQRRKLLQALAIGGGVDVTPESYQVNEDTSMKGEGDDPPEELTSKAGTTVISCEKASAQPASADTGRVPKKSAATRLIFGALGLKTPRTREQADALQVKLSKNSMRKTSNPDGVAEVSSEQNIRVREQQNDETDAWWNKLTIDAVECCDEGIKLSTPPFPFRQRWDPHYSSKHKARANAMYVQPRKRQRGSVGQNNTEWLGVETYDKYNANGSDALNYDDEEDDDDDDDYHDGDRGGILDADEDQVESEIGTTLSKDQFPALPADITTLPDARELEAVKGDFIVYKELACSASTNWQPSMVIRTAQLGDLVDGLWTLTLALRDMRQKEYDKDGNRVYAKFEVGDHSEDEEEDEDRERAVAWSELIEPRLLQRLTVAESTA